MDDDVKKVSGRAKGGAARKEKTSPERLSEIGRMGAEAKRLPKATHDSADHPLRLGNIDLSCYVLEDGTRVLSQAGLQQGIGMSKSGGKGGEHRIAVLVDSLGKKGIEINNLTSRIRRPIRFVLVGGGIGHGFEATVLADLCDVVLAARQKGFLQPQQMHIADQCEILVRGFARVGIIALVDEATGYQEIRPQDALQAYLEKIISKELAAWVKKFPDEFYENIYKLKGWTWPGMRKNRYSIVGTYTRDLVFERIAPGLLPELEKRLPKDDKGNRTAKLHQHLTDDIGNPMLAQHLHSLVMLQRVAINSGYGWQRFVKMVDAAMPKRGNTLELPLGLD
ncbi:P63C domain-containing protein [Burkholderia latens]|uniref:P63C domain-containing protein n=1 Tax=Burkholderia latens TaxID=488446 RepID=UPI001AE258D8|nr:P63C domain-containing protein [Burkholderia latens]QTO42163.1 P63C domain-containing protein [Burkholderia latens]